MHRRGLGRKRDAQSAPRQPLKDIADKLDIPPLKPELRKFVEWVSGYTLSPRGMVLRMALRMGEHLGPERVRVGVRMAGPPPQRMTAARARVLALLADGLARAKGDAAREAGVSAGVVDGLIDEGTLEALPLPAEPAARPPDPGYTRFPISRRPRPRRARRCASVSAPAATRSRCSTASPAPARPRSISRRWRKRYRGAARA